RLTAEDGRIESTDAPRQAVVGRPNRRQGGRVERRDDGVSVPLQRLLEAAGTRWVFRRRVISLFRHGAPRGGPLRVEGEGRRGDVRGNLASRGPRQRLRRRAETFQAVRGRRL